MAIASRAVMHASADPAVAIDDPERANLLELMLASVLARRLGDPRRAMHARGLAGAVVIEAGEMHATLMFGADGVAITRDAGRAVSARIRGTLPAVIDAALGRHRAANLLAGRLRVTGHPRVLWHLLGLLRGGSR